MQQELICSDEELRAVGALRSIASEHSVFASRPYNQNGRFTGPALAMESKKGLSCFKSKLLKRNNIRCGHVQPVK